MSDTSEVRSETTGDKRPERRSALAVMVAESALVVINPIGTIAVPDELALELIRL